MQERRLKFKAHFNRVNMQRGNPNVWTVHNSRTCFQGEKIRMLVPAETAYNQDGPQPRAYFKGFGFVRIENENGKTVIVVY